MESTGKRQGARPWAAFKLSMLERLAENSRQERCHTPAQHGQLYTAYNYIPTQVPGTDRCYTQALQSTL